MSSPSLAASRSLWVRLGRMDPRYPVSFLIHAHPRARRGALRHPWRVRAARHRARRLRGRRARAVAPAARLVRERAERLHHRYQPRAIDQAPGRSASGRSPWADSSRSPPSTCCATAAGTCGTPATSPSACCCWRRPPASPSSAPMGQRPGHKRGDLGFRASHRVASPHAPCDAHLRGVLHSARGAAPLDCGGPAARRNRADSPARCTSCSSSS